MQYHTKYNRLILPAFLTRKTARWIALLGIAGAAASIGPNARADNPDQVHYPDLQTWTPYDLTVERSGKTKLLRFSNTVANRGEGPLEVEPVDNGDGTTDAFQVFYAHDEAGNWYAVDSEYIGTFEFHPTHNHWHFENFARYELRTVAGDGSIGSHVLSSRKVSFCIMDTEEDNPWAEHADSEPFYRFCGRDLPQGLSVGWADTYGWWLPDQDLDISDVKNGDYWLVSTADPDNWIDEGSFSREGNNTAAVKIRIRGNKVSVVREDEAAGPAGLRR